MSIESRVKDQFPALFITLVSVLTGLVFADLIDQARERMTLWPVNIDTIRTWAQIFSMGACTFALWAFYSHIGVTRHRVPSLADSVIAFVVPVPLLIANSLIGRTLMWPWLYYASGFNFICFFAANTLARMAQAEHPSFSRLSRPAGSLMVFTAATPSYLVLGWLDQHGFLSRWMEVAVAASPMVLAAIAASVFLRDWRRGVAEASK
jgi:hypothetical protein